MGTVDEGRSSGTSLDDGGALGVTHRWVVATLGAIALVAGGVATFVTAGGAAAAALIAAGLVLVLVGLRGRWPDRLSVGGHGIDFSDAAKKVVADAVKNGDASEDEVRIAGDRLRQFERTGRLPEHPAARYDRDVVAALESVFRDGTLVQPLKRSRSVPDFEMTVAGRKLLIETKWKRDEGSPWKGTTMELLVRDLPQDAVLLVVTNAKDVNPGSDLLSTSMGKRARVVSWRSSRDNDQLRNAVSDLLHNR